MRIPGYVVTGELHRGRVRAVYRAIRESDGRPVILKTLADEEPGSASAVASLRREFEILRSLDVEGVIRADALYERGDAIALILEDSADPPLASLVGTPFELRPFLKIALRLASIVAELHQRRVVHRDLNPKNILVDAGTGRVTLIDFGIAWRLGGEADPLHGSMLEGTIAYMSPEQTGRMNRDVDYRTDFYSLGVTFYEMLAGRPPFDSADPLEVVHAHLARSPAPLTRINASVPAALEAIVLKLLAKTAEARYQSAAGLHSDLAECLRQLDELGQIGSIEIGRDDVSDRFVIPQRLYGREREIAALLAVFGRACDEAAELMLVSGYAGIGKTSLIQELHRALGQRNGWFIAGKFDQLVRNVPYAAITQAFSALVRQILTEPDEAVAQWRSRLLTALGTAAGAVVDVIPELERVIGAQPPAPSVGATEAQNRFQRAFGQFLGIFAKPEHPLVVFLDDLQWADSASLALLRTLMADRERKGFLLIGAYRDNEMSEGHPLLETLGDIRSHGAVIDEIRLGPLDIEHVEAFVADTLHTDPDTARPLARLILQKTAGNPFFVTQFLSTVHQEGLLTFDYDARAWRYDLAGIDRLGLTDNVVDLMARRIRALPAPTQDVLRLAACIGNRFDVDTLVTVNASNVRDTALQLSEGLRQGLVVPLDQTNGARLLDDPEDPRWPHLHCRFLHDRVQQAAYALIPAQAREALHLEVGRLLLAATAPDALEDRLFEIVDHLNIGAARIDQPAERERVAQLDLRAGQKAKASTAYQTACRYFEAAVRLLPADCWATGYDLAFPLHLELAECLSLSGRFVEAEQSFESLVRKARTAIDRAEVFILRTVLYENTSEYGRAIDAAREGLEPFGVALPARLDEQMAALDAEIRTIRDRLGDRAVAQLIDLPVMTDAATRTCMRLLAAAWAPAYIANDAGLIALIPARMVRLSLAFGNAEESAVGYVVHGITVGSRFGDYATGHEFGRLALAVNDRFHDLRSRAKVQHLFSCFINLWRMPIRTCFAHSRAAWRAGLESGDFAYATYACFHESWYALLIGTDLERFESEAQTNEKFLRQIHMDSFADLQRVIVQWGRALRGATAEPGSLDDDTFRAEQLTGNWHGQPFFETFLHVSAMAVRYTFGRNEEAVEALAAAEPVTRALAGTIWPALLAFYGALTLAAHARVVPSDERAAVLQRLRAYERELSTLADNNPMWFGPHHLLVAAELANVEGRHAEAVDLYERALRAADALDEPRIRALVNELYGTAWLQRGHAQVAAVFLRNAVRTYARWGAAGKAADLRARHPDLVELASLSPDGDFSDARLSTMRAPQDALDAFSVVRATQAIASEIELDNLVARLVDIAIQNAGAQRGVLVLHRDGRTVVGAEGQAGEAVHAPTEAREPGEVVPAALIHYVLRARESVVLENATQDPVYGGDPYIVAHRPRSVLCAPVLHRGEPVGALYLQNDLATGAFTPARAQFVQILCAQAAISIRNAQLFTEVTGLRDRLQAENVYLLEEIRTHSGFEDVVGTSPALMHVLRQVEQVAAADTSVLIQGETGTGKELIARAIHALSRRRDRTLVTINCGAISPNLVESELFGHERGAFTGAVARKIGRFELADGGTLFLDEVGDLPPDLQVRLLRVLQEGEFERVGGTRTISVNVRVIAATHRDLGRMAEEGRFRPDLYYRLNVFPIVIPPLRERREDIPLLVQYYVNRFASKLGRRIEGVRKPTLDALSAYAWPGNVRELRNVIERSVLLSTGSTLELGDWAPRGTDTGDSTAPRSLSDLERDHIVSVLESTRWRVSGPRGAAVILGLKPTTLEARMKKLGIRRPD